MATFHAETEQNYSTYLGQPHKDQARYLLRPLLRYPFETNVIVIYRLIIFFLKNLLYFFN